MKTILMKVTLIYLSLNCVWSSMAIAKPEVIELMKSSSSWNGGAITYPAGEPEISAYKVTLQEDEKVSYHCHPVPTFGYLLKGKIQVRLKSGETKIFTAGQAVMEVMNTLHKGIAVDGPVEFLVFYAGAKGINNTYEENESPCKLDKNNK